jgi:sortase A
MPGTPLPGQPGNAVISGHRTTYGRPFFDFDLLEPGDRIEVETSIGIHVYEVRESLIVAPTDVWVTDDKAGGWLTLTTCNPKFSARERLIISAEMIDGPNLAYIEDLEGRLGVS